MRARAVILAGGEGSRLGVLTAKRAKPAVPFAGKYRIIDFVLSNCVNSGIFDVLVLTQYRPHSLNEHIALGRPWDLDRSFTGGVKLLQPYQGRFDTDWYAGTADAVTQNLNFVRRSHPRNTVILSGDHIYEMDYDMLIDFHEENNADATVCVIRVPMDEASRYGIMAVNEHNHIVDFVEKPAEPPGDLANMGVYVFKTGVLDEMLMEDALKDDSRHDFGYNIIPSMIAKGMKVIAYPFGGYWIDVGTIDAYWEAHMDLLDAPPSLDLNDRSWIIHTRSEERPPVRIEAGAIIEDSMITDGAVISAGAHVVRSVISPGVYVGPDAYVYESVILTDSYIEKGARIERSVIDKGVVVSYGARVGEAADVGDLAIACVGKNTTVPPNFVVERSAVVGTDLDAADILEQYPQGVIHSGEQVKLRSRH
ncbi:glucose-1-phosphate adenylyltransferase [Aggregatilinea lenta]|uniref:glucose-1-phosphate adenylyltransferase n=1 Tax=Aggregatilinea lenta TaxID=913108 RepID=UPI000E5BFF8E|nr:glucose-1-phosphate adenylyltransferase [Aggregatilinea lenta]